ncbi:AAA domain-containing protein [Actinophytocola sediminis]
MAHERGGALWLARDHSGTERLLQTWDDDQTGRAKWTHRVDLLRRISAAPGSESGLLTLHACGVSGGHGVLVYAAPGGHRLVDLLAERATCPWLVATDPASRAALWGGLAGIAAGLDLLHDQAVLHRLVSAESVFVSPAVGPVSLRLGGFAHAARPGEPVEPLPENWASDPDASTLCDTGQDWFGFGMLAARCLLDLEALADTGAAERAGWIDAMLARAAHLVPAERDLIRHLVRTGPGRAIVPRGSIVSRISEIRATLAEHVGSWTPPPPDGQPLSLLVDPAEPTLRSAVRRAGLTSPNPTPADVLGAVQDDLDTHGVLLRTLSGGYANGHELALSGTDLTLRLSPAGEDSGGWQAARCAGAISPAEVPASSAGVVVPTRVVVRSEPETTGHQPWTPFLPPLTPPEPVPERTLIIEALRFAAQIELLLQDAESYGYTLVSSQDRRVVVRGTPRGREPLDLLRTQPTVARFFEQLMRRRAGGNPAIPVLVEHEEDTVDPKSDRKSKGWRVEEVDVAADTVRLVWDRDGKPRALPETGTIRVVDAPGQLNLVGRHQRTVRAVGDNRYLLRGLTSPETLRGVGTLRTPVALPADAGLDDSKRAALADIAAAEPLYALQGPPGTGKTTFVAWLIRWLLDKAPDTRILVAAQSHAAIEVLMARTQAVCEQAGPLMLRRGNRSEDGESQDIGTGGELANELLDRVVAGWELPVPRPELAAVRQAWLDACQDTLDEVERQKLADHETENWRTRRFPAFVRRVETSAAVVFCTSSAPDLDIADTRNRYDWCVLEEAGKIPGFELCTPLATARRWLLIGDTAQLLPYRVEDYEAALDRPEEIIDALRDLRANDEDLIDRGLIRSWDQRDDRSRAELVAECRRWLQPFRQVRDRCLGEARRRTVTRPVAAQAGVLTVQHRMHPRIGDLVSTVYYNGRLRHSTVDETGVPLDSVHHHLTAPVELAGRAVAWLDTSHLGDSAVEWGPEQNVAEYVNVGEGLAIMDFLASVRLSAAHPLDLALLSPYAPQVQLLSWLLANRCRLPAGLEPVMAAGAVSRSARGRLGVFTVDSFQGNQADVVVVSLTRANHRFPGTGLGFLRRAQRINVLVSRAERLLVLAGNWEFFHAQVSNVPLRGLTHPLWHWRKLLALLADGFDQGWATRVPVHAGYADREQRELFEQARGAGFR